MGKEKTLIDLTEEVISEVLEAVNEVLEEEVAPLIKYRQDAERKAFEKQYREMKELEEGEVLFH